MIGADRPFIDRPIRDRDAAGQVAAVAAQRWGLALGTPQPLRVAMNALYPAGNAMIRIGHTTAPTRAAVELSELLIAAGIPTVPALPGMALDLDVGDDEWGAIGWQRVRETRQATRWEIIGAAVRKVHQLDPATIPPEYPVPSPRVFEWWQLDDVFAQAAPQLDSAAANGLSRVIDRSRDELASIDTDQVICHGDVHENNVINSALGPMLIDWDLLCWANPAWDHAALLAGIQRWGLDPGLYDAFAAGYGRSYLTDPVANMIAAVRNVVATLLLARAVAAGTGDRVELDNRLRYWRGDDGVTFRAQ